METKPKARFLAFKSITGRDERAIVPIDRHGPRAVLIMAEYNGDDGETYCKVFYRRGAAPHVPQRGTHDSLNALKYQGITKGK